MKSVVVTGVSTGIGWGIVKVLVRQGFRVFGSVRKKRDAQRLVAEFGGLFVPLTFDITDETKVQAAASLVRGQLNGETLFGLVNNAGVAEPAPMQYQPTEAFRYQIEVNLIGPFIVTKVFLPLLGADRSLRGKPGRLINISSVGGKIGAPFLGAYAASKHGLEGMSESLRRELMLYGIDVIIVGPGSVATPIWEKADKVDISGYDKTEYAESVNRMRDYMVQDGRKGYPPEKVGEVVWRALTNPKPKVRYSVVPGTSIGNLISNLLPKRVVDGIIAKNLGYRGKVNGEK
jgi:NAD(P)-dependent dehydrogenase (short-subunit alcohol dehydrogenase family)